MATSLFSGTPNTATSYSTSSAETPKWMQDAVYNQIQWATNAAQQPLEQFAGPTVAPMNADQQAAMSAARSGVGAWQQPFNTAQTGLQGLSGATSVGNVNQYMNPFMSNVTDRIAQLGQRNLTENLLPGVSDSFVRAGQFGGNRMGEFASRALRDTQDSILGQQGSALQQGYTQALGASQADLGRQQQAMGALGQMAQQGQQLRMADVGALDTVGQAQQAQAQREIDAQRQIFAEQQAYPKTQLDWLSTQVRGMQPSVPTATVQSGGSTGQSYQASPLSQLASAYSMYKGLTS